MSSKLGNMLVAKGLITEAQRDEALRKQRQTRQFLGEILIEAGAVEERVLLGVLAEQHDLPFVDLNTMVIAPEVLEKVPAKFAWHYNIMPIDIQNHVLTIAIANPFDTWPVDDLATNLGYRVEKALAVSAGIQDAIKRHYGVAADTIERIMAEEDAQGERQADVQSQGGEIEDLEKMAEATSVIKVVNQIFHQAITERATDIHLEYYREAASLRYRVDGVLRDARISADLKYLYPAITSRIKIMSGLDIIERRLPQDGRAKVKIGQKEYDLRVSVIPTIYGENIVVRILPTTMLFSLTDLGRVDDDLRKLQVLIRNTNGIVFVTGPTGSGKSTTLYAALKVLNERERKLVTIEDPVEYELRGVSQLQVNPKIELTFARALRSMLRHDPDVIMVGEIRDRETANIAVRAALTGHLVLSTLHTNDAAGGVNRLLDIGVEPYLVASSVRAFLAQRLVRTICPQCKQSVTLDSEILAQLGRKGSQPVQAWQGAGCDHCDGSGYYGRTGIYEVIRVDEKIRNRILAKDSADAVRSDAREAGSRSLKEDGFNKVLAGVTSADEVLRVTEMDD